MLYEVFLFGERGPLCMFISDHDSSPGVLMENGYHLWRSGLLPSGLWWSPTLKRLTVLRKDTEVNLSRLWICQGPDCSRRTKGAGPAFSHTF